MGDGILLIDKPLGITSSRVGLSILKKWKFIKKIGHAGTLDPEASGLLVLLLGSHTKYSDVFSKYGKEYITDIHLGSATDTYDHTGITTHVSHLDSIPTLSDIQQTISINFDGKLLQTAPIFSAKKQQGKPLYELARKRGAHTLSNVQLPKTSVSVHITIISYQYPILSLKIKCSSGTYIRSLAHDLGIALNVFGHTSMIRRTKIGKFDVKEAIPYEEIISLESEDDIKLVLSSNIITPFQ